jgi:g-D-glutamyl-meso-diaminopimelate peptidase
LRSGDTLWYYSQLFQLPIQLILDSNPGVDPSNLQLGQTVQIPGYIAGDYTVAPGDTLWKIATERGIPLDAIFLLNPNVNPQMLYMGQTLQLPVRVTWPIVQGQRPYTYAILIDELNRLSEVYPFIRRRDIGSSVMGKPIPAVEIGIGPKRVHANGSFHANEWITTPIIMRFLNDYLLALTNNSTIRGLLMEPYYRNATLSLVPMVNPDGVDLVINGPPEEEPYRSQVIEINGGNLDFSGWKANIRGVDLNDQFPANWDIEAARREQEPSPRDYPGPSPLSEPEAQAMAELTRSSDFARVLAFHTQGEEIYWGYEGFEPPESETIVNEFARVSGYTPVRYVDSHAGFKDWFIQEWRRPGFTIELGSGVNPLPLSQFEEIYQESLGIFLASLYM